jgi:hypothetical protein
VHLCARTAVNRRRPNAELYVQLSLFTKV